MTSFEQEKTDALPQMEVVQLNSEILDTNSREQNLLSHFLEASRRLFSKFVSPVPNEAPDCMSEHFGHAENRNDPNPSLLSYRG